MTENIEHVCDAEPYTEAEQGHAEEKCGAYATLMIKYEQREWPMYWGTIQLCDKHREKIWAELERLIYMG